MSRGTGPTPTHPSGPAGPKPDNPPKPGRAATDPDPMPRPKPSPVPTGPPKFTAPTPASVQGAGQPSMVSDG